MKMTPKSEMKGKLKLMGKNHSDELYTPQKALDVLLPYLDKNKVIWECAYGTGRLAEHLRNNGFKVVGHENIDFLDYRNPKMSIAFDYDIIITNPPFSRKIEFIRKCYEYKIPFALLLPLTTLEGIKIQEMFKDNGIQIIFPKGRIDFNGKKSPWFYTCWFTWGLNLPKELNFNGVNKT